jgi:decaprenylphospho-beta-D-ribofuranose 2-oxidase
MVTWLDGFGKGPSLGRGLFHAAWYAEVERGTQATLRPDHQELPDSILGFFPKNQVWKILRMFNRPLGMRAINAAKYHASRILGNGRPHFQSLVEFSFLLDYVPGWQKAYRNGFVQYQPFVPEAAAPDVFRAILEIAQKAKWVPNLGVMKRHRTDAFLLSHGVDGYSLAMDFNLRPGREREFRLMTDRMTEKVLEAGGRFYPAKDSLLDRESYSRGVGSEALARFQVLRQELDPDGMLGSGLIDRLVR